MTTTEPQPPRTSASAAAAGMPLDFARVAVQRTLLRWAGAAVGAALTAEGVTADLIGGLCRRATQQGQRVARLQADRVARVVVTTVAASPVIDRVMDHQLQRVLRPVVLAVLDDVLLLLEKEPERIQALVRGQRDAMVDELVDGLREGTEAGDTAVDRLTSRVLDRGPRPGLLPSSEP